MTNKKIKILDDLELATPEVEKRVVKESIKSLIERDEKFKKEAFSTPIRYLRGDLLNVSIFLNVLIEKLNIDFFNENDMKSYNDSNDWIFKNLQINYNGNEKYEQDLLNRLLLFTNSLDIIRLRLYENESTENKSVIKKYEKKEYEKQH